MSEHLAGVMWCCDTHRQEDAVEIARLRAEVERLRQCRTCGGIAPSSGRVCICGGSNFVDEEIHGLRLVLFEAQRRAEAVVRAAEEEAGKPFIAGTQVTNCVVHLPLEISRRPRDCDLCFTDILNHYAYAIRVNEWLNARLDEIRASRAAYRERA